MANKYGTIITTAGAALIADCILNGTALVISQAAAGDGGGAYYEPIVSQPALVNECWRGGIASAQINAETPNMLDVKVVIPDDVGGFVVRELGLYSEAGELIAICNTPDTEKVAISGGVSGKLTMVMHIVVADASVMEFVINPSLDAISQEELDAALSEHNASATCHADIRALALNSVQQGDVYTKSESDTLRADAITEHNNDATAHPAIQVTLTGLDSRLTSLELKYGTNVTGNSFEVTFTNLTGLVVTGVWNEAYARIEF